MDRSAIDGAVKQLGDVDDPMAVVEVHTSEHLVLYSASRRRR